MTTVAAPTKTFTLDEVASRWRTSKNPDFAGSILRRFVRLGYVELTAEREYVVTPLGIAASEAWADIVADVMEIA